MPGTDARNPANSNGAHAPTHSVTQAECCELCVKDAHCTAYVYGTDGDTESGNGQNCWPLTHTGGTKPVANRVLGLVGDGKPQPKQQQVLEYPPEH